MICLLYTSSREKAEELLLQASEEKADFTSIAEKNSLNSQIKLQLEWGPDLKEPDRSAFALEADEISDIICLLYTSLLRSGALTGSRQ